MITDVAPYPRSAPAWQVLHGPIHPADLQAEVTRFAASQGLTVAALDPHGLVLTFPDGRGGVTLRWRRSTPERPDTLSHVLPAEPSLEILLDPHPGGADVAQRLAGQLAPRLRRFSQAELDQIVASMPLLSRYAVPSPALEGWAVIFRDHYVENTLGFLLALERAGVPARWIYALAKGDRTHNRDRVHATLLARGCASGVLDNTAINAPDTHADELACALAEVDAFIDTAHAEGRRVLVVDDGGLLAQGYGHADAPRRIDAALELTVSGLKRIASAEVGVPVLNMARSELKTNLGYPEIADSCLRRLRALLPGIKVTGRPVVVIGYGALGSRLAQALRAQGCQIYVVDSDPLALIAAAETGHRTYRTAAEALRTTRPFLIVGTTGEAALCADDLRLLPDGAFLAPFATRDFSILANSQYRPEEIPGIGRRYRLDSGSHVTLLGDGRSLNLFEADAIPNQGYDAYRAGTLIAAIALCEQADRLPPGVHTDLVDTIVREAGLYDAYYDTYLATTQASRPAAAHPLAGVSACVVGYGAAGRLHAEILAAEGAALTILDPKHQDLPKDCRSFPHGVTELPSAVTSGIGLWSVCCPTSDHLPVLRSILSQAPDARVLLEKPACQGHEIDAFAALLSSHRNARVVVTDQYRHARVLDILNGLIFTFEPNSPIDYVGIVFTKDRTADIAQGRFVDRFYGVLGYEWLHMLAVLRRLLPAEALAAYLATPPQQGELWATYDSRLFVSALTERASVAVADAHLRVELMSSITSPTVVLGSTPRTGLDRPGLWQRGLRPADDRHRHITVHAGRTQFTAHLDPVTATGGWQLERNHHRVTVERAGELLHDEVVQDSPLHTSIRDAVATLIGPGPVPPPDLNPLRRIAMLAEFLRAQQRSPEGQIRMQPA
ncbi:NAD-binding protein [Microbispora sp. H10836]|uniref:NAD-binding protein n=1 Tax=Microbispora sp. H10836 TaxID=2729106 RepID=UPI001B8ADA2D|nr:NAD-binding protein [Microbispora sp. H10836]